MKDKVFEDQKLIEKLVAGNISAFDELYTRFYQALCSYATRIIHDSDEAEDIVQNVMHKLWENKRSLDGIKNLRSYIFRSVYNGSINYLRFSRHKNNFQDDTLFSLKEIETEGYDSVEYNELQKRINTYIEELPDQCKKTFKLSRLENKSYQEIAGELEITVKAVEANISRALKTLRKNLKDYLGPFL